MYELYGVSKGYLYYYAFQFNNNTSTIKITASLRQPQTTLDGTLLRLEVTSSMVIVTCSNCAYPAVNFYNAKNLSPLYSVPMTKQRFEHFNLAVFERDPQTIQVFAAGRNFIDMIEYQENFRLEPFWQVTRNIYTMPVSPNANFTHEIFIAKNADYLVYKLTSEERIYTMGICDRSKIFNVTTFTCD